MQAEIEARPEWHLAWRFSEVDNDNAPLGWGRYIPVARWLLSHFDLKEKRMAKAIPLRDYVLMLVGKVEEAGDRGDRVEAARLLRVLETAAGEEARKLELPSEHERRDPR